MSCSILELVLIGVFAAAALIQLFYYWFIFGRLAFYKSPVEINNSHPPVSIVMVARNEYYNLSKNLPLILNQDYPDFEVVVVNHVSDDETNDLLNDLKIHYHKLKVVNITQDLNFFKGKKFPLSLGIKSATNDILLLTDADCTPNSDKWIRSMVKNYSPDVQVVLGYGPYVKKKGFINFLVRYDTFIVAMQYLSYALAGCPYMGVGRNLSYSKTLFFSSGGFASHYKISSGDDDLLIGKIAHKQNTRIEVSHDSFMYSEPKATFGEWIKQKQRHLTTGRFYKLKFKFLLGIFSITQLLFYVGFVLLLIYSMAYYLIASIFIFRFISQLIVQKKVMNILQEKQLLIISPLLEIIYLIIMPIVSIKSVFLKSVQWK
jgi:cellulose synthase/poly-beta-1,6-N-acetylglucosamine synthase-like glycosyltransferase